WGDGTTATTGTITGGGGTFFVQGTHTYLDEGTYSILITLADDAPGTAHASATTTATVTEADVLAGTGLTVGPPAGAASASAPPAPITWGDGPPATPGTITGGSGSFIVAGTHTYADEGAYTITVTLADDAPGTAQATARGTATVAEADVLAGTGLTITP